MIVETNTVYMYVAYTCMMVIFQTFLQSVCNNIYGLFLYTLRLDFFTTFTVGLPRSIQTDRYFIDRKEKSLQTYLS